MFFFQAEDGIRDLVRSRGLGDVYKRQVEAGLPDADGNADIRGEGRDGRNCERGADEDSLHLPVLSAGGCAHSDVCRSRHAGG